MSWHQTVKMYNFTCIYVYAEIFDTDIPFDGNNWWWSSRRCERLTNWSEANHMNRTFEHKNNKCKHRRTRISVLCVDIDVSKWAWLEHIIFMYSIFNHIKTLTDIKFIKAEFFFDKTEKQKERRKKQTNQPKKINYGAALKKVEERNENGWMRKAKTKILLSGQWPINENEICK